MLGNKESRTIESQWILIHIFLQRLKFNQNLNLWRDKLNRRILIPMYIEQRLLWRHSIKHFHIALPAFSPIYSLPDNEIKKTKLHLRMENTTLMVNDVNKLSDAENAIEEKLQKM